MSQLTTIKIPNDWIKDLPKEDLILEEVFKLGVYEYKIKRAIHLYKERVGSLLKIPENINLINIDKGEKEAITLALSTKAMLLMDEELGRTIAR